jgi:hypothetical protein
VRENSARADVITLIVARGRGEVGGANKDVIGNRYVSLRPNGFASGLIACSQARLSNRRASDSLSLHLYLINSISVIYNKFT